MRPATGCLHNSSVTPSNLPAGSFELNQGWEFRQVGTSAWHPAQVPGHVHLDLQRSGIIAEPVTEQHELGCQWVDEADWEYRTRFNWGAEGVAGPIHIRFQGLDTVATVSLNGVEIGKSDNMFVPMSIDVTSHLIEGTNELAVSFESAVGVGKQRREAYFAKEGIMPEVGGFDERAFVRKAPYMSGWDWGPRLVSCGIWKPVELITGPVPSTTSETAGSAPPLATLVRTPDSLGESFEFHQNGKRQWIRGANWIPDSNFPSQLSPARLAQALDACQEAGINMLRVWGGGLYESDLFYELCLERGILVWQDFIFACSYSPDDEAFLASIEAEARAAILRLRRFPNLVIWCGNNENHTMWDAPWHQGASRPSRFYGEVIYEKLLPTLVAELDPGRPYIPSSPTSGTGSGSPLKANDEHSGDSHVWDVWHGRGDWRYYEESKTRFASEFGFASAPCLKTWSNAISAIDATPTNPIVRHHDKTGKDWATFKGMVELHYPPAATLEDWIYFSQLNQRDAMRCALEHYRRGDFCSGTLIWQLNDCWPVQSWSLYDCDWRPKAAAFEAKRIHADILLSIEQSKSLMKVHAINDGLVDAWGRLTITAIDLTSGEVLRTSEADFLAKADSRTMAAEFDVAGLNNRQTIITAQFGATSAWRLLTEPKQLALPEPGILNIEIHPDRLCLHVSGPLVDLMLTDEGDPSAFATNFLTLTAPGPHWIRLKREISSVRARSLAGHHQTKASRKS